MSDCGLFSAVLASRPSSIVNELLESSLFSLMLVVTSADDDDENADEDEAEMSLVERSFLSSSVFPMLFSFGSLFTKFSVELNSSHVGAPFKQRQKNVLFSLE